MRTVSVGNTGSIFHRHACLQALHKPGSAAGGALYFGMQDCKAPSLKRGDKVMYRILPPNTWPGYKNKKAIAVSVEMFSGSDDLWRRMTMSPEDAAAAAATGASTSELPTAAATATALNPAPLRVLRASRPADKSTPWSAVAAAPPPPAIATRDVAASAGAGAGMARADAVTADKGIDTSEITPLRERAHWADARMTVQQQQQQPASGLAVVDGQLLLATSGEKPVAWAAGSMEQQASSSALGLVTGTAIGVHLPPSTDVLGLGALGLSQWSAFCSQTPVSASALFASSAFTATSTLACQCEDCREIASLTTTVPISAPAVDHHLLPSPASRRLFSLHQ